MDEIFATAHNCDPSHFSNTLDAKMISMLSKTITVLVCFFKSAVASLQCQRLISLPL